jgi:hypothetical protein
MKGQLHRMCDPNRQQIAVSRWHTELSPSSEETSEGQMKIKIERYMTKLSILYQVIVSGAGQCSDDDSLLDRDEESLLDRLTPDELRALNDWACSRPCAHDSVDLMVWPGWNDVDLRMQANMQLAWQQALDVVDRIKVSSKY